MAFGKSDKKSAWGRKPSGGSSGAERVYTLQVNLDADRLAACVIEIAGSHTLEQLHCSIDAAFDREGDDLWDFQTGVKGHYDSQNRRYGPPDLGDDLADDASETTVDDLKLRQGSSFGYTFSLDTPLEHAIEVVGIAKAGRALSEPRIVSRGPEAPLATAEKPLASRPRPSRSSSAPAPVESGRAKPAAAPVSEPNAQAAACSYILVALLQRVEKLQPGLTADLLAGIEADRAAIADDVPDREYIEKIFDEALKTVRQASAGNV